MTQTGRAPQHLDQIQGLSSPEHVRIVGVLPVLRWLEVHIRLDAQPLMCCCRRLMVRNGTRTVRLVDLPSFGQPARLVWAKQRWRCPTCSRTSTEQDPTIASSRCAMTTRANYFQIDD